MKPTFETGILLRGLRWLRHVSYWQREALADPADREARAVRRRIVGWAREAWRHWQLATNSARAFGPYREACAATPSRGGDRA
jgi:hypothetical protein